MKARKSVNVNNNVISWGGTYIISQFTPQQVEIPNQILYTSRSLGMRYFKDAADSHRGQSSMLQLLHMKSRQIILSRT